MPVNSVTRTNDHALRLKAAEMRLTILQTALRAGKGHVPPALSWVEIAVTLFQGGFLRLRPDQPHWPERDRFILSKGHGCLTLYAALADLGFFPAEELDRFGQAGAMLAGHPDPAIPGVEAISGSLGHGLGIGSGLALSARLDSRDWRVRVVLGDGECQEGSVWEAAMFAAHHGLDNLTAIIDRNGLQATAFTEDTLRQDSMEARWRAFGWDALTVDGHDLAALATALERPGDGRPRAIIAATRKGKGIDFMENSPQWHHQMPNPAQAEQALAMLRARVEDLRR